MLSSEMKTKIKGFLSALGAALLLALGWFEYARAQQSVIIPATTTSIPITGNIATTLLVTGQTGKSIYITSLDLIPTPTAVVALIAGTGATCGTNTVFLLAAVTFSAGQIYTKGSGYGAIFVAPQGFSVCIIIQTAITPGSLSYAQF